MTLRTSFHFLRVLMSASVQRKLKLAHQSLGSGDVAAAARLCEEVLERAPRNPEALWLLGTAALMQGRAQAAVPVLERALAAAPERGSTLESLGLAYLMTGEFPAAEGVLRRAAKMPGAPPSVRMRLGIALLEQGQYGAAIAELERAVTAEPRDRDAQLNLGRAYAGAGEWSDAQGAFERVLAIDPHSADALYNLGLTQMERGEPGRARVAFERVLARDPDNVDARERLAASHFVVGRFGEALEHLQEAVRKRPADAALKAALADAFLQTGTLDDAYAAAQAALGLDAKCGGAHGLMALIHYLRGELDQAIHVLERGFDETGEEPLLGSLVHLLHRTCEWPRWKAAWERLAPLIETSSDIGSPFWLLCERTSAGQQLSYTRRWAGKRFGRIRTEGGASASVRPSGDRLRVGYFSSDFQDHAVAHLVVEALELHDRERFEIYAYSYGPDDGSAVRARLQAGIEHFVDVAWEADDALFERMRGDSLDVLVDLKGYTAGDRLGVMARRPCPVQVTWLGYPGTTGADFIDYLIADEYIIPYGAEHHYSERVLRLPTCYQPNDRKRERVPPLARRAYGLPENAFVFCCFNQAVKIVPEVFARWMSLLRRVPGSVLWILEENRWGLDNLKRAAEAEGVDGARIIVAERLPNSQHLARFAAADLALDTFPYTSHTTASDALWMGCPLVALCGETFAARVSSSIVSSCGLRELVTHTLDEYEALAYRLAVDTEYKADLNHRLESARSSAPSFDSEKFARDLEALYLQITC